MFFEQTVKKVFHEGLGVRANSPCLHVYVLELAPTKTVDLVTLHKSGSIGNIVSPPNGCFLFRAPDR